MTKKKFHSVSISPPDNVKTQKWMENTANIYNPQIKEFSKQINNTSLIIGGTITALNSTLQELDKASFARIEPNINAQIVKNLEPYRNDLDSLRSQLQSVKDSLEPIGKSLLENVTFFSNSIAVQGKLQGIDSINATILKRIEMIENDNNRRWNKRATTINIICTLLGVAITFLGVVVAYWLGVFK